VNWQAKALKHLAVINMGQSPSSEDCNQDGIGVPFLQGNAEFGTVHPMPKQYCDQAKKIAEKGSYLFSVRAPVGALNVADRQYGIGRGLCALTAGNDMRQRYLYWVLLESRGYLNSIATGSTFEAVSAEQISNTKVPLPPLDEQTQIAKFLDYETAKIDALIAKQQQLIALLQEKRQAVISHAVTKGLNPAAPLRDSGVAWLGQVPAHWEVKQLRRVLTSIEQGTSPSASANPPDVGETGVLKISAIKNGVFREFEAKSLDGAPFEEAYRVRKGDLLVTRGNTPDLVADSCVVREEPKAHLMMSDLIYRLNVSDNADANFLCLWLLSSLGRLQIKNDARGSSMTMAKIAQGHIKAWLTTLPPVDEQKRIVDHVDQMNGRTSLLLSQCGSLIQLLQERRTALISAAVTGKIDVRGWQPPPAAAAGATP
jgi:type I restriction enzyme S subunit